MTGGLDPGGAEALLVRHLGGSPRAGHSRAVGGLMAALATRLGADAALWQAVGLVHDIDYFAVGGDWSRHGIVAAEWLADVLPPEALAAIRAHDHRTGIAAEGPLADALKLADALAILDQHAGRAALLEAGTFDEWRSLAGVRPFLVDIIAERQARLGLGVAELGEMLHLVPEQQSS